MGAPDPRSLRSRAAFQQVPAVDANILIRAPGSANRRLAEDRGAPRKAPRG